MLLFLTSIFISFIVLPLFNTLNQRDRPVRKLLIFIGVLLFISVPSTSQSGIIQLTDNSYDDRMPQINDSGQVVWYGNHNNEDDEIFLYNGTTTIQLTDNSYDDSFPRINNIGQVVWEGRRKGAGTEMYLYNGTTIIRLTDNSFIVTSPETSSGGQVVWSGYDGSDWEIFLHHGNTTIQLTDNPYDDYSPRINDRGLVVWYGGWEESYYEIYLYNGTTTIQLTENSYNDSSPELNNSGQVVWMGSDDSDREIYLYTPEPVIPKPDIKADGSDGPVTVSQGDTFTITGQLDAGSMAGQNADWWLGVNIASSSPDDWYHYDPASGWIPGMAPTHQGPLFNLSPYDVPGMSGLSAGMHTFYLAVDLDMNGLLDMDQVYYDSVQVTVAQNDTEPPSVPAGLTATAISSSQINLSWIEPSDNLGVVGYKVYRNGVYIKSLTATSFADTALSESTYYCYGVSAYDAAGNESEKKWPACIATLQNIRSVDASGYWAVYHTETSNNYGVKELGPEYWYFNQRDNSINISFSCQGHKSTTGSISGATISFSWIERGENVTTLIGTVDDSNMEGTYSITSGESGLWRAEKSDVELTDKQRVANSAHAVCHVHNGVYAIEGFVCGLNRTADSVVMTGPDITNLTLNYEDDHNHWWNMDETGANNTALPLNYNFGITFSDGSKQNVSDTVTKCVNHN
jgi:hypothetical protein